jgi:hypothetical protein
MWKLDSDHFAAWQSPVTVRLATPADQGGLERLAEVDSRPLAPGPHLVAERDGRIDAALSLATRELVADPFRHTAELRELLLCHASPPGSPQEPSSSRQRQPRPVPVAT